MLSTDVCATMKGKGGKCGCAALFTMAIVRFHNDDWLVWEEIDVSKVEKLIYEIKVEQLN